MQVELDSPVSFDSLSAGDAFEHNDRLFVVINQPGSAVALDNGGVDSNFTGANMVFARLGAIAVALPSPDFTP